MLLGLQKIKVKRNRKYTLEMPLMLILKTQQFESTSLKEIIILANSAEAKKIFR